MYLKALLLKKTGIRKLSALDYEMIKSPNAFLDTMAIFVDCSQLCLNKSEVDLKPSTNTSYKELMRWFSFFNK